MANPIPNSPWNNPLLEQGTYAAEVYYVTQGSYGGENHPYFKIVFLLAEQDKYFVSNLYFPHGKSLKSQQRLWHFCGCVGMHMEDIIDEPSDFVGKHLRICVKHIEAEGVNHGNPYADVARFLPPLPEDVHAESTMADADV